VSTRQAQNQLCTCHLVLFVTALTTVGLRVWLITQAVPPLAGEVTDPHHKDEKGQHPE